MTGIFIGAKDSDKNMWGILPRIIKNNFSAATIEEYQAKAPEEQKKISFLMGNEDNFALKKLDNHILICKDEECIPKHLNQSKNAVAVVQASNPKLVEKVSLTRLPALTCGLSTRDTLILSSINEDSAVLGVQRSIICFDGTVAEPQDIPIRLGGHMDTFTLMAAASVFILSGNIGRLRLTMF